MAFAEDLTQFFNTDEFAVLAVFKRQNVAVAQVNAIFDQPTLPVGIYEAEIDELQPRVMAPTAELAEIQRGDICELPAGAFRVEKITHDGTGVSTVYLAKHRQPANQQQI